MSEVTGYILILNKKRYTSFRNNMYGKFAEPVPEFDHSRYLPLVCFITDESKNITHIGSGKRGFRAGTDLRKLNIEEVFELEKPISAIEIAKSANSRVRHHLVNYVEYGGLISPKSFETFLSIFLGMAPETDPILQKYSPSSRLWIEKLSQTEKKSLAEQKEAVLTAMNIAGIDRKEVQGWNYSKSTKPTSYLDGLAHVRLREDSTIINDLGNIPGFELIKSTKYTSSVFVNEKTRTRLTVLLTNRLPLEELLGTDLIYYNEDFKSFVMVQYKMMEEENETSVFRLPNKPFFEEITRMESILNSLKTKSGNGLVSDYRFNENPFFIKICPRLEFDPDHIGLSHGMYIPLDYIKILQHEKSIEGKNWGKAITYDNIGRYFDNTAFKTIIEGGWIGTNQNQSLFIEQIIKDILMNGKTAVLAIKEKIK